MPDSRTLRSGRIAFFLLAALLATALAAAPVHAAAPVNDNFADAIELPSTLPIRQEGTNHEATREEGEPFQMNDAGGTTSVWYRWTPSESKRVLVNICGATYFATLGVFTGPDLQHLESVDTPGWTCNFHGHLEFDAVADTTYWISVGGFSTWRGEFALTIEELSTPANDNFADAQELSGTIPTYVDGTTHGASLEPGETEFQTEGATVWYRWTPAETARVKIHTCGATWSHSLAVYTGGDVVSKELITHNFGYCDFAAKVTVNAVAGTTYWIQVSGVTGTSRGLTHGTFQVQIEKVKADNDDFEDAAELPSGVPFSVTGSNVGSTNQTGEPLYREDGASVWYDWTPTQTVKATLSTCGSSFGTVLRMYTGDNVRALKHVAVNGRGCRGISNGSEVSIIAQAGTTYRIAVDGLGTIFGDPAQTGDFVLTSRVHANPPPNDDFAGAAQLPSSLEWTVHGTLADATTEPGEPAHLNLGGDPSVWFTWTPDTSGTVFLDNCESSRWMSAILVVYEGDSLAELTRLSPVDDSIRHIDPCGEGNDAGPPAHRKLWVDVTAGETYYVAMTSYDFGSGEMTGPIQLRAEPAVANDDFADAQPLSGSFPIRATGSTVRSTVEAAEPLPSSDPSDIVKRSVWYRWTPTATRTVTLDTCGGEIPGQVGIFTGSSLDALTPVKTETGDCWGQTHTWTARRGTTYRILVWQNLTYEPNGSVLVIRPARPAPDNDDFANARALPASVPLSADATSVDATTERGEPDTHDGITKGNSIWFTWKPKTSGLVAIDTCGSAQVRGVGVYTGSSVRSLTTLTERDSYGCGARLGPNDDPRFHSFGRTPNYLNAVAGKTYRIVTGGPEGAVRLNIRRVAQRPANDDFANAQMLSGDLPVSVTGSSVDATHEVGEPSDTSAIGAGRSIWYSWTPTVSQEVRIDTCESEFRTTVPSGGGDNNNPGTTVLSIWRGDAVGSLTPVQGDLEACSGNLHDSYVLQAVAGTTYRIAVDGEFDGWGTVKLLIRPTKRPANDDFENAEVLPSQIPLKVDTSSVDATTQPDDPRGTRLAAREFQHPGGASLWYRWTAPSSGRVRIDTCGTYGSLAALDFVAVFTGEALESLTDIVAGGLTCSGHVAVFDAVEGTEYRIVAGRAGVWEGPLHFEIKPLVTPANDAFEDAQVLPGALPVNIESTTTNATVQPPAEPAWREMRWPNSVWFRWTPTETSTVTFCWPDGEVPPGMTMYTGDSLATLKAVPSKLGSCDGRLAIGAFDVVAGTTYSIAALGDDEDTLFHFQIRRAEPIRPPANDDFANAQTITSLPTTIQWDGEVATREAGEPNLHGTHWSSIWYRWRPRISGQVTIDTCTSINSTALAVFTGNTLSRLDRVVSSGGEGTGDCNNESRVVFKAEKNTTYTIGVGGLLEATLNFRCSDDKCPKAKMSRIGRRSRKPLDRRTHAEWALELVERCDTRDCKRLAKGLRDLPTLNREAREAPAPSTRPETQRRPRHAM